VTTMATLKYPTGDAAVLSNKDGSITFFSDANSVVLAHFQYGVGFISYPSGATRAVFTKNGGFVCNQGDGSAGNYFNWPLESPFSIVLNSYLTLQCSGRRSALTINFATGHGTEVFNVGVPVHDNYRSSCKSDPTTGRLLVPVDRKKHPGLMERSYPSSRQPTGSGDRLPRLSSSGREVADFQLPVQLQTIKNNNDWMSSRIGPFTTDIGHQMAAIKQLQTDVGKTLGVKKTRAAPPDADDGGNESLPGFSPEKPASRNKLFSVKNVPLKTLKGGKLTAYLEEIRGDQLCLVCATDNTSKEAKAAASILRAFQAKNLNQLLEQQDLDASKTDVAALLNQLDCQVVLADCLTDRSLGNKYGFAILPMFLIFLGPSDLVFIGNRFVNRSLDAETLEFQVAQSLEAARNGVLLPRSYRFPNAADATFKTAAL